MAQPTLSLRQRLRRVWPYFSKSRGGWTLAVGATIVASATEPFVPALLKPLLDRGFQKDTFNLWLVPLSLMLLFGIRGLSGFIESRCWGTSGVGVGAAKGEEKRVGGAQF